MDHKKAENDLFRNKLAIALSIIRNKPDGYTSEQYCILLQSNFYNLYASSAERIDALKHQLFETRKQLFLLEHKEAINKIDKKANEKTSNGTNLETLFEKFQTLQNDNNKNIDFKQRFNSRVELMANLIKLKSIGKNFKLNENMKELIVECLSSFLEYISQSFFNGDIKPDFDILNDDCNYSSSKKNSFKEFSEIPMDCMLHSLQVFLNVYDIEWLYYLRSCLVELIDIFVNDLINFITSFSNSEKNSKSKLICATQMIIIISTSDYLLNPVLFSIIKGLQFMIEYICSRKGTNLLSEYCQNTEAENIAFNCWHLIDCIEFIINIRSLDNFSVINNHVKERVFNILNTIFINLTEIYPLLAIKMSKLIQLLDFGEKNSNKIN